MASNFSNAQNFQIDNYHYVNVNPSADPLSKLEARIAAGAIHDSAERCDAPKCHPETRVAVQDDLYGWIVDGDENLEHPKKMKWVTGPAGTGKTAVVGSLSERCKSGGVLAATFFFASWSTSIGRRRKSALVTTIAHQLAQYHADLRKEISKAVEAKSDIFDKNLHVQMDVLILGSLQEVARRLDGPDLRGAIIIDGLDECESEQYHDTNLRYKPLRTNAEDQMEVLQVLQAAASDPSFPFRILIASRPERVFREFFGTERNPTSFAQKLDLNEEHQADADITLFPKSRINIIRRRYNFPPSWPPPGTIQTLVKNASGQFIYAATVIRLLDRGHREPPKALLEAILRMRTASLPNTGATQSTSSSPFEQLDALYSHILTSSPDPTLSVMWIRSIARLNSFAAVIVYATNIHLLLQANPESNEAEHLLGNLHSLIRIPPPSDQATSRYDFYHKSLFDFFEDPGRCRILYVDDTEIRAFTWNAFVRACMRGCDNRVFFPGTFLDLLARLPNLMTISQSDDEPKVPLKVTFSSAYSYSRPMSATANWWVWLAIANKEDESLWSLFQVVHTSVRIFQKPLHTRD